MFKYLGDRGLIDLSGVSTGWRREDEDEQSSPEAEPKTDGIKQWEIEKLFQEGERIVCGIKMSIMGDVLDFGMSIISTSKWATNVSIVSLPGQSHSPVMT